ncbi:AAA family ATPase [Singulisphaera rosea]
MLERLSLKNFSVFRDVALDLSPGINVFIGANATGKTHAMKAAYSLIKSAREREGKTASDGKPKSIPSAKLVDKLAAVFRPDGEGVGRLVRRSRGRQASSIDLKFSEGGIVCSLTAPSLAKVKIRGPVSFPSCLFLPTREVLSIFQGFLAAYQNRELAFDETYYDLCLALSASPLRGQRGDEAADLWRPLGELLNAKVVLQKDSFYLNSEDDGEVEAHLVAEGYRKVATLIQLIANGSLAANDILFWDEPETNLNPRLIRAVADFLLRLAAGGVQVVIATHDYLLTNELSLNAEYQTQEAIRAPIRFFSFVRNQDRSVSVQAGDTLADLDHNPIMEEFAALYDRERILFSTPNGPLAPRKA